MTTPQSYQEAIDGSPESRNLIPEPDEALDDGDYDWEGEHDRRVDFTYGEKADYREWAGMEDVGGAWV